MEFSTKTGENKAKRVEEQKRFMPENIIRGM